MQPDDLLYFMTHRMRNLAAKAPEDLWPEFKARVIAAYQTPSRAIARDLASGVVADYQRELPSASACFEDDFEACIAHRLRAEALEQLAPFGSIVGLRAFRSPTAARSGPRISLSACSSRSNAGGSRSSPTPSARGSCSSSSSAP